MEDRCHYEFSPHLSLAVALSGSYSLHIHTLRRVRTHLLKLLSDGEGQWLHMSMQTPAVGNPLEGRKDPPPTHTHTHTPPDRKLPIFDPAALPLAWFTLL